MAYSDIILADTPVAYYRCEDTSGLLQDSSGNARHTTASTGTGVSYSVAGRSPNPGGNCIEFTTGVNWFTSPDGAHFDLGNGPFSLEAWCMFTDTGTTRTIFSKGTNAYFLGRNTSNKFVLAKAGVAEVSVGTTTLSSGTWYHVVVTKTGSTNKMYVNGVDDNPTVTDATLADTTTALYIGTDSDATSYPFYGKVDELAIYNYVLTPTQVSTHYNGSQTPPFMNVTISG